MADDLDPFASIGGGKKLANGGWVPANHPLAQEDGYAAPDPTRDMTGREMLPKDPNAPQADTSNVYALQGQTQGPESIDYADPAQRTAAAPASNPADPFASIGGGVQIAGGGWVPKGHPLAQQGAAGGGAAAGGGSAYTPPNAAPGTPGSSPLDTQTSNAQTYSQTPGAAPSNASTNQGTQDTVRNTYLQQIQKGTAVDTNDPNFRQQSDAYAAAQERARRNALDDISQENFAGGTRGSGAENVERRMADERSAQNVGQFEGELVGKELTSRRDEIKNALASLGGMIDNDQKNALNRELAALDAAIKRESIQQTGALGSQDLSLRDKLGTGALNVDLLRALLQNQQFGTDAGIRIGDLEAKYSGLFS